ncbi:MAG: HD domain-containing protein [Treponema sp.]|nr:HD domain-containing protein [Treponema sp.]
MIDEKLILKIFEGFSIQRWNDLVRPFEIVEMDKAAEKMVAAYIIGKYEEEQGHEIDWEWMIYASLFDLLKKIALCDIKSPVQRMIRQQYPQEYIRLNEWVLSQYRNLIHDKDLFSRFTMYIGQTAGSIKLKENASLSARVLRAAHKFSSLRELEMLSVVNEEARLTDIRKGLNEDIQEFLDLRGMQLLVTRQRPFDLIMHVEQLRFQTRWNQTPRVPHTSVLGHCFFVAISTLLLVRDAGKPLCPKRLFNDFFCALFHDLPEAVTRDIISPVKQATDELPAVVKHIEDEIVKSELVPLMEDFYKDELMYFTSDEFLNKVIVNGQVKSLEWEELNSDYNSDSYSPVDGRTVRLADHLSAFIEADSSIKYGITSNHLKSGRDNILKSYPAGKIINGIEIADLLGRIAAAK